MSKNISFHLFLKIYNKQSINTKINQKVYFSLLDFQKQGVFKAIKKTCNFADNIILKLIN